mgnify:FL=1
MDLLIAGSSVWLNLAANILEAAALVLAVPCLVKYLRKKG